MSVAGVGDEPMQRPITVDPEHDADVRPGPDTPKENPRPFVLHALTRFPPTVAAVPLIDVDTSWLPTMLRYDRDADTGITSEPAMTLLPHTSMYWSEFTLLANCTALPDADDSWLPSSDMPAPCIDEVLKYTHTPLPEDRKSL